MEALLTIDENWRPTSDGRVSSPWATLCGPTKYIIYNILISQKTGLRPWGCTLFERVHLSERLQTFKKVAC